MLQEIADDVRGRINAILGQIEREHGVRILFAVESGSRAWGFASPDSDYDVRFVYARPVEWYLSLEKRRDVIELPINDGMDVNGWDIQKALTLLLKANPALLEWLKSPIVYRTGPTMPELARLAAQTDHRKAARHHYLHLGLNQFRSQIDGRDKVALKKYFYCLRPAAALRWERTHKQGRVPMDLPRLLAGIDLPPPLRAVVDDLMARKAISSEMGEGDRIPEIDRFVREEFRLAQARSPRVPALDPSLIDKAQGLFLRSLMGVPPTFRLCQSLFHLDDVEGEEAFAFHLNPSFEPDTLVRVVRSGERISLTGHIGTGDWCDQWLGRREVQRDLSCREWLALVDAFVQADFWTLPEEGELNGLDGEFWDFEGRQGSLRHRVSCWCPEDKSIIRLGRSFLDLARAGSDQD